MNKPITEPTPTTEPTTEPEIANTEPKVTKKWLYASCSHVITSYWPKVFMYQERRPVDGCFLMGTLGENNWYTNAYAVGTFSAMFRSPWVKIDVIPGLLVFSGKDSTFQTWTDPDRWAAVAKFMRECGTIDKFAIDIEAYWEETSTMRRYPGADQVREIAKAMTPFINEVKNMGVTVYVIPGIHYTASLALSTALPGKVVDLDEGCYGMSLTEKRTADWKERLLARKAGSAVMGTDWWPGYYWPGSKDQELLSFSDNAWFFLRAEDKADFLATK